MPRRTLISVADSDRCSVTSWLTQDELDQLDEQAFASRCTRSDFVHHILREALTYNLRVRLETGDGRYFADVPPAQREARLKRRDEAKKGTQDTEN